MINIQVDVKEWNILTEENRRLTEELIVLNNIIYTLVSEIKQLKNATDELNTLNLSQMRPG